MNIQDKPRVVTIFDIDGVIIENRFHIVEPTDENFYNVYKNQKIHYNILKIIEQTAKNSNIIFLTGRLIKYKDVTLNMLSPIKTNYKIYFHEVEYKNWTIESYHNYKIDKCNIIAKDYDIIIILDDRKNLLLDIKNNFKIKNKILVLIYAKFTQKINNIQCLEII